MKMKFGILLALSLLVFVYTYADDKKDWSTTKNEIAKKIDTNGNATYYIKWLETAITLNTDQKKGIEKLYKDYLRARKAIMSSSDEYETDRDQLMQASQDFRTRIDNLLTPEQQLQLQEFYNLKQQEAISRFKAKKENKAATDSTSIEQ